MDWNEFYKKINDAAMYASQEAEKLTGVAKAKFKLMNLRSKESDYYEAIGKLCYEERTQITDAEKIIDNSVLIKELCDKVRETIIEIKTAEQEINQYMNNTKTCMICASKIDRDMVYCPKCGAKQD